MSRRRSFLEAGAVRASSLTGRLSLQGETVGFGQGVLAYAVPLTAGAIWYVVSPLVLRFTQSRLRERNPDHFAKMVGFSRLWGVLAAFIGFAVAMLAR